ncbi:MAG: hypothetical protein KF708_17445 [Pirellulales bacterium]|nr:hypothetical protein [Pirellulales bacterium]
MESPHYLLFTEARGRERSGHWHFVLQSVDGSHKFEANDNEPEIAGERLELLSVVRGLEALDQPSRVTIVTRSRYVNRGISHGLDEWRAADWNWEKFGQMVPVKDSDLWRRVDRALRYHRVDCRCWRFDAPHDQGFVGSRSADRPTGVERPPSTSSALPTRRRRLRNWLRRGALRTQRTAHETGESVRLWFQQLGTGLLSKPWLG